MVNSPLTAAQREERRNRALALALTGAVWPQVAEQCGYNSRQAAQQDVAPALAELRKELREDRVAQIEGILSRADYSLRKMRRILDTDHVLVNDGRIVKGDDGQPLIDDAPKRAAAAEIRALDQQRAKLLGLDEATKVDTTQTVTYQIVGVDPGDV